jgi:hypothetical protein
MVSQCPDTETEQIVHWFKNSDNMASKSVNACIYNKYLSAE